MNSSFSDTGIVIRSMDTGEADKYITILSENHGLSDFYARGARRQNSKKAPHLDVLNIIKFDIGRGEHPRFINQAETINFFPKIKTDFSKISLCLTFCEIIFNTLPQEENDREAYLSFKIFLEAIENTTDSKEINHLSRQFGLYLIRHLGFPPPKSPNSDNLATYFETIIGKKIISREIRL
jgi:DNA repair protein RecO